MKNSLLFLIEYLCTQFLIYSIGANNNRLLLLSWLIETGELWCYYLGVVPESTSTSFWRLIRCWSRKRKWPRTQRALIYLLPLWQMEGPHRKRPWLHIKCFYDILFPTAYLYCFNYNSTVSGFTAPPVLNECCAAEMKRTMQTICADLRTYVLGSVITRIYVFLRD